MTPDYQELWNTMIINDPLLVEKTAKKVYSFKDRYQNVVEGTLLPWEVVGCIHYREGGLDFKTHLHNGDSLAHRTVNVPMHRPAEGEPPFTWEESARDALFTLKKLDQETDWSITSILSHLERYNGTGYIKYHPDVLSPYIWSGTIHYKVGKYTSDGHFDPAKVDKQLGCAPLFLYLTDKTKGISQ